MERGFITIATGKEEYYQMAYNLLRSYRHFCRSPLPFAILCDRKNEYTEHFDTALQFEGGASCSYLDKLALADQAPFDETIFIDADCLAYGDLNDLFKYFAEADDVSCFGRVLALDDKTGWFEYENLGELQSKVGFVVGLHGGIYYIRKTEKAKRVFNTARGLIPDYAKFRFKGKFNNPGDEPLVALAMAIEDCRPVPFANEAITCYWEYENKIDLDITKGKASIDKPGCGSILLVHWGTRFTRELEYKKQIELLDIVDSGVDNAEAEIRKCNRKYKRLIASKKTKLFAEKVKRKVKRLMHIK